MAQKKSSAGRGGTKKPTSTARKGTTTKKKTASSRSGSTTRKKAPARSNARNSSRAKVPPREPVRRQVGCGVLLVLGIVAAIGYFPASAWLVAAIRRLFMGFFGAPTSWALTGAGPWRCG